MDAPAANRKDLALGLQRARRRRAKRLLVNLGIFVGLPTLLASFYYGVIASDGYESMAAFSVQSAEGGGSLGIESLIGVIPGGGGASKDTLALQTYIHSRDVLDVLRERHDYDAHYGAEDIDWVSRLPADASPEEALEHFQNHTSIDYDSMSGVLSIRVRAYEPKYAQALAQAILTLSEEKVNSLSARVRSDQIAFAEKEVALQEAKLGAANDAILSLQQEGEEFNPQATAEASMAIRTELESELARARAELAAARGYMSAGAPQVIALAERVASLSHQVKRQNQRLLGDGEEESIGAGIAKFESASMQKAFAQAAYRSALTSLEVARAEAARQHRYVAVVAAPSLPGEPLYPERARGIITALILSLALFGIGSLLLGAVREHAKL